MDLVVFCCTTTPDEGRGCAADETRGITRLDRAVELPQRHHQSLCYCESPSKRGRSFPTGLVFSQEGALTRAEGGEEGERPHAHASAWRRASAQSARGAHVTCGGRTNHDKHAVNPQPFDDEAIRASTSVPELRARLTRMLATIEIIS